MIKKTQHSVHNIYLKLSDKLQFLLSPQHASTKPSSHQEVLLYLKSVHTPLTNLLTLYLEKQTRRKTMTETN